MARAARDRRRRAPPIKSDPPAKLTLALRKSLLKRLVRLMHREACRRGGYLLTPHYTASAFAARLLARAVEQTENDELRREVWSARRQRKLQR